MVCDLSQWRPESLRFFLADDRAVATELYVLLCRYTTGIVIASGDGGASVTLPPAGT